LHLRHQPAARGQIGIAERGAIDAGACPAEFGQRTQIGSMRSSLMASISPRGWSILARAKTPIA
jgi:hypothetical protein